MTFRGLTSTTALRPPEKVSDVTQMQYNVLLQGLAMRKYIGEAHLN